jgi:hypothetical protein
MVEIEEHFVAGLVEDLSAYRHINYQGFSIFAMSIVSGSVSA